MKTILDDFDIKWFLEDLVFSPHTIRIILTEPKVTDTETIDLGNVQLAGSQPITTSKESRQFEVLFENIVAHQIIDESYTKWEDYEEHDSLDHSIMILSRSHFLDYLQKYHSWLFELEHEVRHFRVWTYDAVIEIATSKDPIIRSL